MKKLLSLTLVCAMLLAIMPFGMLNVSAENGVRAKLEELATVYYTGTYFTESGEPFDYNYCTYPSYYCEDSMGCVPSRGGLPAGSWYIQCGIGNGHSCNGFATYCFAYVFGEDWRDAYKVSSPSVGDLIVLNNGAHYAIYLGEDNNYYYVYDSNYGYNNGVRFNGTFSQSKWYISEIFHARNYDEINGSSTPDSSTSISNGLCYDWKDDNNDGYYIVSGYNGTATEVVIPAEYKGLPVKEIGNYAFASCESLTSVIIPDSLTAIGTYAFYNCKNLTSITIGNSVTTIGNYAFSSCESLTSVVIPDSVTIIGERAFFSCENLTSVTIGNSVTTIGNSAFAECNNLISVSFGDSVTTIGNYAFYYCKSLTSVVIPDSVSTIGQGAFYACENLTGAMIGDSVTTIGDYAFAFCDKLTSIVIPDSVTTIGDSAFDGCYALTSVVIPDSVTTIGDSAFSGCENLTSIDIPDSVTKIGDSAFSDCDGLTSIVIGDSVTAIGDGTFSGCDNLESMTVASDNTTYHSKGNCIISTATNTLVVGCANSIIPDSVTKIGESAFAYCDALTSMEIPDSVTTISNYAFIHCNNLTSVTIGASVTAINNFAFFCCDNLESITVAPSNVVYHSAGNCIIETATNTIVFGCKNSVIPSYVTTIGYSAFRYCENLKSINIPDSVKTIGDYAFSDCWNLTSVVIPDSVITMGFCAFSDCKNLINIYCETVSEPEGWDEYWNEPMKYNYISTVHWGYVIEDEDPDLALGDIDGDENIATADYVFTKRAVMGTYSLTEAQKKSADIDKDGDITTADYVFVKRAVMGTYVIQG